VAAYADALRGGSRIGDWGWNDILRSARQLRGDDPQRAEFLGLVETAQSLVDEQRRETAVAD
jgi:Ca-activated chloride channel family protein